MVFFNKHSEKRIPYLMLSTDLISDHEELKELATKGPTGGKIDKPFDSKMVCGVVRAVLVAPFSKGK